MAYITCHQFSWASFVILSAICRFFNYGFIDMIVIVLVGIPGYFILISHIFLSKSWCRTLICIGILNETFLQAFVIIFYSISWTNKAKMKLITQSMTLNPWWRYPNPTFCLFSSQPLLVYLPCSIYLSSTESKWNTLPQNPNHYYYFEEKFSRIISFFSVILDN